MKTFTVGIKKLVWFKDGKNLWVTNNTDFKAKIYYRSRRRDYEALGGYLARFHNDNAKNVENVEHGTSRKSLPAAKRAMQAWYEKWVWRNLCHRNAQAAGTKRRDTEASLIKMKACQHEEFPEPRSPEEWEPLDVRRYNLIEKQIKTGRLSASETRELARLLRVSESCL